jgi:hypothetical protein
MTLSVEARSLESARELCESLAAFRAELLDGGDGSCNVTVVLADASQAPAVLRAIEKHVMESDWGGTARIHLDGSCYRLHTG